MRSRARLAGAVVVALVTVAGLGPVAVQAMTSAATAATETQLSETGWTASSNTNSSAADAPANAIDGNINTRFSSDADQASGMYFQVNLGSAQTFNQIEMNSGGSAGDYARGYNVEVSTNGSAFTSVATGTGTSSPETVTFAQ
jgi:beta-glucosidase